MDFGMRPAKALVRAFTDNLAVVHDDRTDKGIRLDGTSAALG
jgi:hypothetical protein